MKKLKLFFLSIIIIALSLFYAFNIYDSAVYSAFYGDAYDHYNLSFRVNDFSEEDLEVIKETFKKYDQGLYVNLLEGSTLKMMVYTDEEKFIEALPLKEKVESLYDFDTMDSYDNKMIQSFKSTFALSPLAFEDFSLSYPVSTRDYDGKTLDNLESIKAELKTYDIDMAYELSVADPFSYTFEYAEYFLMVAVFFLGLALAIDILNQSDKIAKYRIEGYGKINIFIKIAGRPLLGFVLLNVLSALLISALLTVNVLDKFNLLGLPFLLRVTIYSLLVVIASLIMYLLSLQIKIPDVLKGRLYSKGALVSLYFIKVLMVMLFISTFALNSLSIVEFIRSELAYPSKLEFLSSFYQAGIYTSSGLNNNVVIDNNKLYEDLKSDKRVEYLIEFEESYVLDENGNIALTYYIVNDDYLKLSGLKENGPAVYASKDFDKDKFQNTELADYELVNYDKEVYNFSSFPYTSELVCDDLILVYNDTSSYDFYIPGIAKCDGDYNLVLKDAYKAQGLDQMMMAENMAVPLNAERSTMIANVYISALLLNIALIFGYIILTKQIRDIEMAFRKRRYFLEIIEGHPYLSHLRIKALELLIILITSFIFILFTYKDALMISLLFLVAITILELALELIFNTTFTKKVIAGETYENRNQ